MTATAVQSLDSIQLSGGQLLRTKVPLNDRPVVVFHKQHAMLQPRFRTPADWQAFLDGSHGSKVMEIEDKQWRWSAADPIRFNCHALSIGSSVGLSPDDWIEGTPSEFTLYENPTRVLLENFFHCVASSDAEGRLECDQLKDGQTLTLENESTGDIVHSGTIRIVDEQPMVISKLGEHPIILSTLQVLLNEYSGQATHIRVYELKDND